MLDEKPTQSFVPHAMRFGALENLEEIASKLGALRHPEPGR
jgi:hypothetical protein